MSFTQDFSKLVEKKEIAPDIFDFTLFSPVIAAAAKAGQFFDILCDGYTLRRPISICEFDVESRTIRIVFEVRGKGTEWLSHCKIGDELDIIGPLGNGFEMSDPSKKAVLIGGGIGTPPLLPIAQFYGKNAVAITGFRSASAVILQKNFEAVSAETILCTDDGSAGFNGFTTQALEQYLKSNTCDIIYTCGPKLMMRGVAKLAEERNIPCQVSMEERMGCGVGSCLCCVCGTKDDKGKHLSRVCLEGPVFSSSEVDWDV